MIFYIPVYPHVVSLKNCCPKFYKSKFSLSNIAKTTSLKDMFYVFGA